MADRSDTPTLGSLPERAAARWGAREALAFQGRRWTFADVHARVDAAAKGLLALGIEPGDRVALWMVNRPEWIDAMFAIMKIGAILVPVNTRFRTEDMAYVLGQSEAAAVILAERSGPIEYLAMMREVAPRLPRLRHTVVLADTPAGGGGVRGEPSWVPLQQDWRGLLERGRYQSDEALAERAGRVDPEQDAFIFYTSGTTGFPK